MNPWINNVNAQEDRSSSRTTTLSAFSPFVILIHLLPLFLSENKQIMMMSLFSTLFSVIF